MDDLNDPRWLAEDWPEDPKTTMLWDDWYDLGKAYRDANVPEESLKPIFDEMYGGVALWRRDDGECKVAWEGFIAGYHESDDVFVLTDLGTAALEMHHD